MFLLHLLTIIWMEVFFRPKTTINVFFPLFIGLSVFFDPCLNALYDFGGTFGSTSGGEFSGCDLTKFTSEGELGYK